MIDHGRDCNGFPCTCRGQLDPLVNRIIMLAEEIDHTEHSEDEEHTDVCFQCSRNAGWFGKHRWPCIHHRHANMIRRLLEKQ